MVLVTPTCPYNDILWLFFLPGLSMTSDVPTTTSLNCLLSQLQAVSCLRFCRGAVKGAARLCSQGRNGNMLIKFHGNHFEEPMSSRRCLGSCGPRLGCSVDFEWRMANFPLCSCLGPTTETLSQWVCAILVSGMLTCLPR